MPRSSSPSFVHEVPLKVTPHDERELGVRFLCGQKVYNATMGEGLKRLEKMKASPEWAAAKAMPKRTEEQRKARKQAFQDCCKQFGFTSAALSAYATKTKNDSKWIADHLGAHETQKIAQRAYAALFEYCIGKRGRPRFKALSRFRSLEGQCNTRCIMWKGDHVAWDGLKLEAIRDTREGRVKDLHAYCSKVKYVRIVWRWVNGRKRYYAQLILEGIPARKPQHIVRKGIVGGDPGPRTWAAVGETGGMLKALAPSVKDQAHAIKVDQRKIARSMKAMNPDNYNPDGTIKKGAKKWIKSRRQVKAEARVREKERVMAATRKRDHGELVHESLKLGDVFRLEKTSGKALQKRYGKSVKRCAPMEFLSRLKREAERAGGGFEEFSAYKYALSQYCHKTRTREKKPLDVRWHEFRDGSGSMQRDIYSAWLARFATEDAFDTTRCEESGLSAEPLLEQAVSSAMAWAQARVNLGRRRDMPSAFGFGRRPDAGQDQSQTGAPAEEESAQAGSMDAGR